MPLTVWQAKQDRGKYHFSYLTLIYLCKQVKTISAKDNLFLAKARIMYCS